MNITRGKIFQTCHKLEISTKEIHQMGKIIWLVVVLRETALKKMTKKTWKPWKIITYITDIYIYLPQVRKSQVAKDEQIPLHRPWQNLVGSVHGHSWSAGNSLGLGTMSRLSFDMPVSQNRFVKKYLSINQDL